jgi:hypothetical protein
MSIIQSYVLILLLLQGCTTGFLQQEGEDLASTLPEVIGSENVDAAANNQKQLGIIDNISRRDQSGTATLTLGRRAYFQGQDIDVQISMLSGTSTKTTDFLRIIDADVDVNHLKRRFFFNKDLGTLGVSAMSTSATVKIRCELNDILRYKFVLFEGGTNKVLAISDKFNVADNDADVDVLRDRVVQGTSVNVKYRLKRGITFQPDDYIRVKSISVDQPPENVLTQVLQISNKTIAIEPLLLSLPVGKYRVVLLFGETNVVFGRSRAFDVVQNRVRVEITKSSIPLGKDANAIFESMSRVPFTPAETYRIINANPPGTYYDAQYFWQSPLPPAFHNNTIGVTKFPPTPLVVGKYLIVVFLGNTSIVLGVSNRVSITNS